MLIPADKHVPEHVVTELIEQGNRVIRHLSDQPKASLGEICDRELIDRAGNWCVVPMNFDQLAS